MAKMFKVVYYGNYGGWDIPDEVKERMIELGFVEKKEGDIYNLQRHHPLLVQAFEEYKQKYPKSSFRIKEIKTCKYYIEVYEGWETVRTPTDMPWINIEDEECKRRKNGQRRNSFEIEKNSD